MSRIIVCVPPGTRVLVSDTLPDGQVIAIDVDEAGDAGKRAWTEAIDLAAARVATTFLLPRANGEAAA